MKSNEIRTLSQTEIAAEVAKRRQELLDLRIQGTVGRMANPRRVREAKREIARFLTVAHEEKLDAKRRAAQE